MADPMVECAWPRCPERATLRVLLAHSEQVAHPWPEWFEVHRG